MKIFTKQSGAVSLFVVIFATLLITVITISFVRIMIQSQQQASSIDLSQSAYDSAQVGVEDAKRALLRYQKVCNDSAATEDCDDTTDAIISKTCENKAVGTVGAKISTEGEVKVQTISRPEATNTLNQAYTCVIITPDTSDVTQTLKQDESTIIPLRSVNPFVSVQLDWYSKIDNGKVDEVILDDWSGTPLFYTWGINRPSIMRTQLIQFGNPFNLDHFNQNTAGADSDANTVFLYPSSSPITESTLQTDDVRQSVNPGPTGQPKAIECEDDFSTSLKNFACSAKLVLPTQIGAGNRTAFLRLTSLYKLSTFKLTLLDSSGGIVLFDNVQPAIDSTGRANDQFRRVESRVLMTNNTFPFPDAEIDITGNLCKDFRITDKEINDDGSTDYLNNCYPDSE